MQLSKCRRATALAAATCKRLTLGQSPIQAVAPCFCSDSIILCHLQSVFITCQLPQRFHSVCYMSLQKREPSLITASPMQHGCMLIFYLRELAIRDSIAVEDDALRLAPILLVECLQQPDDACLQILHSRWVA